MNIDPNVTLNITPEHFTAAVDSAIKLFTFFLNIPVIIFQVF